MDTTALAEKPTVSDEDLRRVEGAFGAAPGTQRVLLAAMEACRERPRTAAELDEVMEAVLSANRSVFGPVELRAILERYGALVYEKSEGELAAEAEAGRDPAVDVEGNLVVTVPDPGCWVLTKAGRAYLEADPQGSYALDLLQREGYYQAVYRELLAFVGEEPRTKPQIDGRIDGHPLLQEPRMFSGHFVGELEKAGALEWNDAWTLTDIGRALLNDLNAAAKED